jgi:hypothetical protein
MPSKLFKKSREEMTEKEIEEARAYQRAAKERSREKKRKAGLCLACGVTKPPIRNGKRLATCDDCNARSRAHEDTHRPAGALRPSVQITRLAHHLNHVGEKITLKRISEELGIEDKHYIKDVLVRHDLWK